MFGIVKEQIPQQVNSNDSEERQQPSVTSVMSKNNANELVCDYDQSVTPLYEMLESSQWDQARIRCHTHPQEVHTWIVRRDANDKIRWKLLPLHAAVIFQAPMPVMDAMLKEHPLAAAKRDDQGMLALHLAFRHKSDEALIEKLLARYPGGVIVKDRRERLPLDHGKDMKFSSNLMRLYSEVYAKCQYSEAAVGESQSQVNMKIEPRVSNLKTAYEARIEALIKEHEQAMQEMKLKTEQQARTSQAMHNQEVDELRGLLSREVASGQKISQLEEEVLGLKDSLAEANQENKLLRRVVHEQKNQQDIIIEEVQQLLTDQKTLHDFCIQQQEQLDQAQQLREQLLRTLLQKEDGKAVRISKEVFQISSNILARTEKLMKEAAIVHDGTENILRDSAVGGGLAAAAAAVANRTNATTDAASATWDDHAHHHDDDISAITENSHF
jgi:hypothetical protein